MFIHSQIFTFINTHSHGYIQLYVQTHTINNLFVHMRTLIQIHIFFVLTHMFHSSIYIHKFSHTYTYNKTPSEPNNVLARLGPSMDPILPPPKMLFDFHCLNLSSAFILFVDLERIESVCSTLAHTEKKMWSSQVGKTNPSNASLPRLLNRVCHSIISLFLLLG